MISLLHSNDDLVDSFYPVVGSHVNAQTLCTNPAAESVWHSLLSMAQKGSITLTLHILNAKIVNPSLEEHTHHSTAVAASAGSPSPEDHSEGAEWVNALHDSPCDGPLQGTDSLEVGAVHGNEESSRCSALQQRQGQEQQEEEEGHEYVSQQYDQMSQQEQQEQRQQQEQPHQQQKLRCSAYRSGSCLFILDVRVGVYMRKDFWKQGVVLKGGLAAASVMSHMQSGRCALHAAEHGHERGDEVQGGVDARGTVSGLRECAHGMHRRVENELGNGGGNSGSIVVDSIQCAGGRANERGKDCIVTESFEERRSGVHSLVLNTGCAVPEGFNRYRRCDVVWCELHGGVMVSEADEAKARATAAGRFSLGAIFRSLPQKETDESG